MKKELWSLSYSRENSQLRSHFHEQRSSGAELCHFYDSSAALFLSKHILEVSSVGCAPQCVWDSLGFG